MFTFYLNGYRSNFSTFLNILKGKMFDKIKLYDYCPNDFLCPAIDSNFTFYYNSVFSLMQLILRLWT